MVSSCCLDCFFGNLYECLYFVLICIMRCMLVFLCMVSILLMTGCHSCYVPSQHSSVQPRSCNLFRSCNYKLTTINKGLVTQFVIVLFMQSWYVNIQGVGLQLSPYARVCGIGAIYYVVLRPYNTGLESKVCLQTSVDTCYLFAT